MFIEPESALANGAMDDEKGKVIVQVRALLARRGGRALPRTRRQNAALPIHTPSDGRTCSGPVTPRGPGTSSGVVSGWWYPVYVLDTEVMGR